MKSSAKTQQPAHELSEGLQNLVAEAETLMSGPTEEQAADVPSKTKEHFDAARDRLSVLYGTARDKVVAGAESTDAVIRSSPYQTIALAAGLGLLLGVLARRWKA